MRKQPGHNGPRTGTPLFEPQIHSTRLLSLTSQQQVSHSEFVKWESKHLLTGLSWRSDEINCGYQLRCLGL